MINKSEGAREKIENIRNGGIVDYSSYGQLTENVNILSMRKDSLDKFHHLLNIYLTDMDIFAEDSDDNRLFNDNSVERLLESVVGIRSEGGEWQEVKVREVLRDNSEQRLKDAWMAKVENT